MFSTLPETKFNFWVTFILVSANTFNLLKSTVLSSGKQLNTLCRCIEPLFHRTCFIMSSLCRLIYHYLTHNKWQILVLWHPRSDCYFLSARSWNMLSWKAPVIYLSCFKEYFYGIRSCFVKGCWFHPQKVWTHVSLGSLKDWHESKLFCLL